MEAKTGNSHFLILSAKAGKSSLKMTRGLCLTGFLVLLSAPRTTTAYPWTELSAPKEESRLSAGFQSSFFFKKERFLHLFPVLDIKYSRFMLDLDLGYQRSLTENKHYLRLSELALTFPVPLFDKWTFSIGSQNHIWSVVDQYWNLGLWQARYLTDPFRPVPMGNPGFYFHYKGSSSLILHLSYFSLPDISIFPDLKNGAPQSKSPFFTPPFTQQAHLSNIEWRVKSLHPLSWGSFLKPVLALKAQSAPAHFQISLSYSYKPVHQFQYSAIVGPSNLTGGLVEFDKLDYSLIYHHLAGLEMKVSPAPELSLLGSAVYEDLKQESFFSNEKDRYWLSTIRPGRSFIAGLLIRYEEKTAQEERTRVDLGYLKVFSRLDEEIPQPKTDSAWIDRMSQSFLKGKFLWKHALSLSLEHWVNNCLEGCQFKFRLTHAIDNKVYHAAFENRLNLLPSIQAHLSGDVLFQLPDKAVKTGSSSVQRYKNQSRILTGVRYVF